MIRKKEVMYVMRIKDGHASWNETISTVFIDNESTAFKHASKLIDYFNDTLRPGELPRVLLFVRTKVKFNKTQVKVRHNWEKLGLVTQKGGYDTYKCSVCGATGKRYGLSSYIAPDKKFTEYCEL